MRSWIPRVVLAAGLLQAAASCGGGGGGGGDDDGAADAGRQLDGGVSDAARPVADAASVALTCGDLGMARIDGTIEGAEIDPVMTAYLALYDVDVAVIVIEETATACFSGPDAGETLVLLFCDEVLQTDYTVEPIPAEEPPPACPGERTVYAVVESTAGDGGRLAEGTSGGTVTLTATGDCVEGSFDLPLDTGDELTGEFAAISCGL